MWRTVELVKFGLEFAVASEVQVLQSMEFKQKGLTGLDLRFLAALDAFS